MFISSLLIELMCQLCESMMESGITKPVYNVSLSVRLC